MGMSYQESTVDLMCSKFRLSTQFKLLQWWNSDDGSLSKVSYNQLLLAALCKSKWSWRGLWVAPWTRCRCQFPNQIRQGIITAQGGLLRSYCSGQTSYQIWSWFATVRQRWTNSTSQGTTDNLTTRTKDMHQFHLFIASNTSYWKTIFEDAILRDHIDLFKKVASFQTERELIS